MCTKFQVIYTGQPHVLVNPKLILWQVLAITSFFPPLALCFSKIKHQFIVAFQCMKYTSTAAFNQEVEADCKQEGSQQSVKQSWRVYKNEDAIHIWLNRASLTCRKAKLTCETGNNIYSPSCEQFKNLDSNVHFLKFSFLLKILGKLIASLSCFQKWCHHKRINNNLL